MTPERPRQLLIYLGLFDYPEDVYAAYVAAAEHFGEFARTD